MELLLIKYIDTIEKIKQGEVSANHAVYKQTIQR